MSRADLEGYEHRWERPAEVGWAGHRFLTRAGLSGVPETLSRLPPLRELDATARVHALLAALDGPGAEGHTTNLVTADSEGNACVLTSSLGLGTGDFLPGLDLQLNSMLGEVDLVLEPLEPGERMQSMMAPSLALDEDGLALAIGSAGGTRLRTALVGVAAGILDEGLEPIDGRRASALPPRRRRRQRRARCRRAGARRSSRRRACTCGAGRRSTTTSAASAWWREQALQAIRGGAVTPPRPVDRRRDRQPADVAAMRAARVRRERAAAGRLAVFRCRTRGSARARVRQLVRAPSYPEIRRNLRSKYFAVSTVP